MPFSELLTDTVFVEKSDGTRQGPFKAAVSATSASIFDLTLDVDEGEQLVRPLPNGKNETYLVTLVEYSEGLHGIPASYTLALQKTTAIRNAPTGQTTVHINNSSGIQVGNHNVLNIQNALNELVQRIDSTQVLSLAARPARKRPAMPS